MRVNSINTYSYSNVNNNNNNNKMYATRPVFKKTTENMPSAILDALVESSNDKRNKTLVSKINFFKDVLFSDETSRNAQKLKEAIESYDSTQNILYRA